ncbi:MAG TPA: amidohydrolase [Anaerolinea thermolimosa]|uniref:5-methylthioadenosine/S-adenosylhomocysteine deaminase n=1 Tax=Anaerolinea thermolimosa TaxID=229919 RepID=A0A3D1JIT0_9CHLR|nr:amidohydrolase [Anaerolinea thermolimosa]GAP07015.1 cytosine deaminase [Anaerolinea thermolimosa]HCE18137.1 amidohydrolase [Anaerolinea thermolimosa]
MKQADLILTNAHVLTMDEQMKQFPQGAVAVQGESILAVGPADDIIREFNAPVLIDCGGKVVMPGLINAHTHVPMTLLRGLADDLRLDVWLLGYMMPVEREFVSPDFVRLGTQIACAEMIRSGVTTFADMYYFEEDIARATAEAGMRALCAQTVLKFPTPDAQYFEESLAMARDFITRWKDHPLIIPSVAPHAPYTCTDEILRSTAALAAEFDVPLHTHLAETAQEVDNMRREQGMPVIPYVKKQGLFEAKVLAAHCVHVDEGELRTMLHAGAGVAHNPSSNLKLASGIAPVSRMLAVGLNVGIGTDGPASNNDLDMFEEIRLAAFLAKGSTSDPTTVPAPQALLMASRLGAQAMHIGHLTGSLEPGKRADLIVVNIFPLHNAPRFLRDENSVYSQLVYAAKSTDVTDVMVNGRWLMRDRTLLTLNETELIQAGQEYARRIDTFLIQREQSILSKLVAIGGAMEEESFEIQVKVPLERIEPILESLQKPLVHILRKRHYHEYDTYFFFPQEEEGILRYREDDFVNEKGEVYNVRSRLTLIGAHEHHLPQVLLSRSRYYAPASHSLRFYREYFKPQREVEIQKDRLRFLISFKETEFFVNLDTLTMPPLGHFLEIKARTWSRKDARQKADLTQELLAYLGAPTDQTIISDYIDMVQSEKR